jgi:hypothetical protein
MMLWEKWLKHLQYNTEIYASCVFVVFPYWLSPWNHLSVDTKGLLYTQSAPHGDDDSDGGDNTLSHCLILQACEASMKGLHLCQAQDCEL